MMKKSLIIFGLLCVPSFALAQVGPEQITKYNTVMAVNKDSTVNVTETIDYDFGSLQRHGIYRDIPYKYTRGAESYNLRISGITVTDGSKNPLTFTVSHPGQNVEIKIGDADRLITGKQTYIISYKVEDAINYFDSYDELYWNAIGTDWQIPILGGFLSVTLPQDVATNDMKAACYAGNSGTSEVPCNPYITTGRVDAFVNYLAPHQAMTIAVSWPKGIVHQPTASEKFKRFVSDNWPVGIPLLAFVALVILWERHGRDPKGKGAVVYQFEIPDGLSPLEIGSIYDERVESRDLTSELIFLAIKGYVKITNLEKTGFDVFRRGKLYQLDLLKPYDDLANEFDRNLLKFIFKNGNSVKTSELKNFAVESRAVIKQVYEDITAKGYFERNPNTVRSVYTFIGMGVVAAGVLFSTILEKFGFPPTFVTSASMSVCGFIIIAFGHIMPRKTEKGSITLEQIKGLKLYMSVAEKDRLEFHNAPEKNPETFEKYLPYAIALKVDKAWAEQFKDIYKEQPAWYSSYAGGYFTSSALVSDMSDFRTTALATFASGASASGGGGGAGGGGGGGGGGSW